MPKDGKKIKNSTKKLAKQTKVTSDAAPSEAKGSRKDNALKQALASAFIHSDRTASAAAREVDTYGKGSPTDRLQFGYAPASADEAIAYHSRFTAKEWIAKRKANGRIVFIKKQKLFKTNGENELSLLKLKNHWDAMSSFKSELRGDYLDLQEADDLLEMLAAKQRVDE